jgi:hypothetical protein
MLPTEPLRSAKWSQWKNHSDLSKFQKFWVYCRCSFVPGPQISKLLYKISAKFVLYIRWSSFNKTFIFPSWVVICMEGSLRTQNFKILTTKFVFLTLNYWTKGICSSLKFVEQNFLPHSEPEFVWAILLSKFIISENTVLFKIQNY